MIPSPQARPRRISLDIGPGFPAGAAIVILIVAAGAFVAVDLFIEQLVPGRHPFFERFRILPDRFTIAVAASLPWFAAVGAARFALQPRRPPAGATTQDLPPEPPAVANMLVNGFEPTREALPATAIDLAARGFFDIEEAGHDRYQLRVRPGATGELLPFEQDVLHLLHWKARNGVVPAEALTTGPAKQARSWWKGFRKNVVDEAKYLGLSRDLWGGGVMTLLGALALPAAAVWWWAMEEWGAGVWAFLILLGILQALSETGRQRHSPAGLQAASRWLGVQRFHREGAFDHLPPTAVTIWERHMAYAAALGVAHTAVRALPMGADDDHRAWSSMGGEWRQVRVRYPLLWPPGWGRAPWLALLMGIGASFLSVVAIYGTFKLRAGLAEAGALGPEAPPPAALGIRIGILAVVVLAGFFLIRSLIMTGLAMTDLGTERQVTGVVLRMRSFGKDDDPRPRRYIAIDEGGVERVRAFRIHGTTYAGVGEGAIATAVVTPRLGHIKRISAAT